MSEAVDSIQGDMALAVLACSDDPLVVVDRQGMISLWNRAAERTFGWRAEQAVGESADRLLVPANLELGLAETVMSEHGARRLTTERACADGRRLPVHLTCSAVIDAGGSCVGAVMIMRDRTADLVRQAELDRVARTDPLTGLVNRYGLLERLDELLAAPMRSDLALLYVDLDGFKAINDGFGHAVGDEVLIATAQRLLASLRPRDAISRLGGDEFVGILPGVRETNVDRVAERLTRVLSEAVETEVGPVAVTASVGVRFVGPEEPLVGAEALHQADLAMYEAKRSGKDRVVSFSARMGDEVEERNRLVAELREGLERGEIGAHFQPIVELATGRVVGVEALARWEHPTLGLLAPGSFLPAAGEHDLVSPIDRIVLETGAEAMSAWRSQGVELGFLSVNVTAERLAEADTVGHLRNLAERNGLAMSQICLEITETTVDRVGSRALSTLEELRRLGVHVALDDFANAGSSLINLRDLPASILKLDRRFVAELGSGDRHGQAVMTAMATVGAAMGQHLVAEGIEEVGQITTLLGLGYEVGQGYVFSAPVDAERIPALVEQGWAELAERAVAGLAPRRSLVRWAAPHRRRGGPWLVDRIEQQLGLPPVSFLTGTGRGKGRR